YFLTIQYGILGPAIANLISFSIYNAIRIIFLWKKFQMHPFSTKTIEVILIALLSYGCSYFLFINQTGIVGIAGRIIVFISIYAFGMYKREISPDIIPVIHQAKKRLGLRR
ncbi:MAG: lipopolysaccharide biosynthesis protein, partial [Ferruginibacter sp.]|nr:lipopolysaccharide biosynthesis protein [Ferruginibacter sp.]